VAIGCRGGAGWGAGAGLGASEGAGDDVAPGAMSGVATAAGGGVVVAADTGADGDVAAGGTATSGAEGVVVAAGADTGARLLAVMTGARRRGWRGPVGMKTSSDQDDGHGGCCGPGSTCAKGKHVSSK